MGKRLEKKGIVNIKGVTIPCVVMEDGTRVLGKEGVEQLVETLFESSSFHQERNPFQTFRRGERGVKDLFKRENKRNRTGLSILPRNLEQSSSKTRQIRWS